MSEAKNTSNSYENLSAIREKLVTRKLQLEEDIIALHSEKFSDDQVMDAGDAALASTMEALRSSLQNKELEEYAMILRVLEKIDTGQYGTCADCGQPISEKRLSVYPNATRCLSCQEALES